MKPMSGKKPFFDTNILIYTLADQDKRRSIAYQLLSQGGSISVQSLNEFTNVARKKLRLTWAETLRALSNINALFPDPLPITAQTHQTALHIAQRYSYSIYDSLLIASALQANCDVLYSEDMHHGQLIEGLRIQNPFSAVPTQ
jgi:predicted nucleic acid-binding protein